MKKKILYLVLFILLFGVVGCDKTEPPIIPSDIEVASVAINKSNETLYVGGKIQLKVSVLPSNATNKTVTWSTSNEGVAKVSSDGLVEAVSVGTATITAKSNNDKTATMTVDVVKDEELPEGVIFASNFDSAIMPRNFVVNNGGGGNTYISDGQLNMSTVGQGTTSANIIFDEALYGTVVVETSIKVNKPAFTNALYFYTSGNSTDDIVATVAFENGYIKYHDGSGWKNIVQYSFGVWYDLTMVLHIGERLEGSDKGNFDLTINGGTYRNLSFRNGGDGKEDNIWRLYLASEKSDSEFAYDYLRIFQIDLPKIQLESNEGTADIDSNPTYEFNYVVTGIPTPEVTITADKPTGYTIADNVVTFTAAGTYVFTLTATNQGGKTSEEVVIEVTGNIVAPLIEVLEREKILILSQENIYRLKYNIISGEPEPTINISGDKDNGFVLNENEISFTIAGHYVFTITATNAGGSVSEDVNILVLETETVVDYDFNEMPVNAEIDTSGTGSVDIVDGSLNIKANGVTNYGFIKLPFNHKLENKVIIETRVKVSGPAFANIIYLMANNNNNDRAVTIGLFEGNLRIHNESTWVDIAPVEYGQYYDIVVFLDIENATYQLLLDNVNLGTFPFRNKQFKDDITHFHLGADKTGTDMYIDYLKLSYLTTPEIVLNEAETMIELSENTIYELDYSVKSSYPLASVDITGYPVEGYTIENDVVTFNRAGVYTFTITASNIGGSDSKTVTITVVGLDAAPTLTINEEEITYDINSLEPLVLGYTVTGYPDPTIEIAANLETGFILVGNTVTFTEVGTYVFTITAKNESGTVFDTITVVVEKPETLPEIIIDEVFNHDLTEGAFEVDFLLGGNPAPTYTITSESDALIEDKFITFSTPGTYLFTIITTNSEGSVSKDFTVEVVELYAPEIVVNEEYKEVNLAVSPSYTLDYLVNGTPEIKTVITVDQETGFSLKGNNVGFTLPGTYEFTITSTNLKGEDKRFIIVDVVEPTNGNYIYNNDFNEVPTEGLTFTNGAYAEVVDGALKLSTTNQGVAKMAIPFGDYFTGTIAIKTRIKTVGGAGNIIFLYSGTTNVLGLLIDGYQLRYHNGKGWTNVGFVFQADQWVEVMAVVTLGSGVFDLYVDGHKFAALSLRNTGQVEFTTNQISNLGIDGRSNIDMYYDNYQIYDLNPVITIEDDSLGTSLEEPTVSLDYQVSSRLDTEVEIISNIEEGYEITGNEITFSKAGTYVFTIKASNECGSSLKNVTIVVSESYIDPEIVIIETEAEVDLAGANPTYTLKYELNIAVPTANLEVTCDEEDGFVLNGNTVRFSLPGTYTFTLNYSNGRATDYKTITVNVLESEVEEFINEDFNSSTDIPADFEKIQSGSGNIEILSGLEGAFGNVLNLRTGTTTGKVDVNKYFDSPLNGIVVVKTRVMVGSDAFSNVLFFKSADNSTVACIAFENGFIRYHAGGGWINTNVPYIHHTWYELKVVLNTIEAKYDFFVNNEYIGNFGFRTPGQRDNITYLNLASDKTNADMYYDYLEMYYVPEILVLEENKEASISISSGTYELIFDVLGLVDPIVITCDQTNGWTLDNKTVTFTEVGTYLFTISASNNGVLTSSKTITILVTD